ncbi:hypothetical protein A2U01_0012828, partial [Trifolium medium]|nr:hypothetical protein [Trifolium medium]
CNTQEQVADIMTKALKLESFCKTKGQDRGGDKGKGCFNGGHECHAP